MRIGTWNLAGRWDERHRRLLTEMDCDVLLLTEVSERVEVDGMHLSTTSALMAPRRRWSAVATRHAHRASPDPHGASALVEFDGLRICSSVLPWRSCGGRDPWGPGNTASRTVRAVDRVAAARPTIWGGDWNHALDGREWSGSMTGRTHVLGVLDRLGLQVPTAASPHQISGLLSIDHVAVPKAWVIDDVEHWPGYDSTGARLSDHDAYVVEVEPAQ